MTIVSESLRQKRGKCCRSVSPSQIGGLSPDLVVDLVVLDLGSEVVWIVGSEVVWLFMVSDMGFCSLIWNLSFDFFVWFQSVRKFC